MADSHSSTTWKKLIFQRGEHNSIKQHKILIATVFRVNFKSIRFFNSSEATR